MSFSNFLLNTLSNGIGGLLTLIISGAVVSIIGVLGWRNSIKFFSKIEILDIDVQAIPNDDPKLFLMTDAPYIRVSKANVAPAGNSTGTETYYKGCLVKFFLVNPHSRDITLSNLEMVIDGAEPLVERKLRVIGELTGDELQIFVINNGFIDINHIILHLKAVYEYQQKEVRELNLERLLNSEKDNFDTAIPVLKPGQIVRIWPFRINVTSMVEQTQGTNRISFIVSMNYDFIDQYAETFLMVVTLYNGELFRHYSQGAEFNTKKYLAEINMNTEFPARYNLPVNYTIPEKKIIQVQMLVSATQTCKSTFHLECTAVGGRKTFSDLHQVLISVPVYEEDDDAENLRDWLLKNEIKEYSLHQNTEMEKEILFDTSMKKYVENEHAMFPRG